MITLDDTYLRQLNEKQIHYSAAFLEEVFLHQKKGLSVDNDDQLFTVKVLLLSVPTVEMKQKIAQALTLDSQMGVSKLFDHNQLVDFFHYLSDINALKRIFQEQSDTKKHPLLQALYKVDKAKYTTLKELMAHKVSMIDGAIVPQDKAIQRTLKKDMLLCLTFIGDPKKKQSQIKILHKHLDSTYELDALEQLTSMVIYQFSRLNIPIKNQQHFMSHLKFYHFIMPYLMLFPSLNSQLNHTIDTLIMALKDMPDGLWVVKIIGQLPKEMIRETLHQLKRFEHIAQFEKRNVYCKLLKEIRNNLNAPEAQVIRQLFKE